MYDPIPAKAGAGSMQVGVSAGRWFGASAPLHKASVSSNPRIAATCRLRRRSGGALSTAALASDVSPSLNVLGIACVGPLDVEANLVAEAKADHVALVNSGEEDGLTIRTRSDVLES
jgi:hypothetical protein